jgi:hypothetical protein
VLLRVIGAVKLKIMPAMVRMLESAGEATVRRKHEEETGEINQTIIKSPGWTTLVMTASCPSGVIMIYKNSKPKN